MRVLVCGGRNYSDRAKVFATLDAINQRTPIAMLIEGGEEGADELARHWAEFRGVLVHTEHALWGNHGRAAGPIRNRKMMDMNPDIVVCFAGGKGTADMRGRAIGRCRVIDVEKWSTQETPPSDKTIDYNMIP